MVKFHILNSPLRPWNVDLYRALLVEEMDSEQFVRYRQFLGSERSAEEILANRKHFEKQERSSVIRRAGFKAEYLLFEDAEDILDALLEIRLCTNTGFDDDAVYFTKCVSALQSKLVELPGDGDSKLEYDKMLNRFIDEWKNCCWIPTFLLPSDVDLDAVVLKADRLLWDELKNQIAAHGPNENKDKITCKESHETLNHEKNPPYPEFLHFLRDKLNVGKTAENFVSEAETEVIWSTLPVEDCDQYRTDYAKLKLKYEIAYM